MNKNVKIINPNMYKVLRYIIITILYFNKCRQESFVQDLLLRDLENMIEQSRDQFSAITNFGK